MCNISNNVSNPKCECFESILWYEYTYILELQQTLFLLKIQCVHCKWSPEMGPILAPWNLLSEHRWHNGVTEEGYVQLSGVWILASYIRLALPQDTYVLDPIANMIYYDQSNTIIISVDFSQQNVSFNLYTWIKANLPFVEYKLSMRQGLDTLIYRVLHVNFYNCGNEKR